MFEMNTDLLRDAFVTKGYSKVTIDTSGDAACFSPEQRMCVEIAGGELALAVSSWWQETNSSWSLS